MSLKRHNRFTVRSFEWTLWAVVIFAAGMWILTLADYFLRLGWGWDVQIIWIAPVIIVGALVTRMLGRIIFRWVGALD